MAASRGETGGELGREDSNLQLTLGLLTGFPASTDVARSIV